MFVTKEDIEARELVLFFVPTKTGELMPAGMRALHAIPSLFILSLPKGQGSGFLKDFSFHVSVYLCVCLCECPQRPEEATVVPGVELSICQYFVPCGCWELNSHLLQD